MATMFGIVLKLFGLASAILFLVYLSLNAFRKARRLDARIQEFKAEQEALTKQGGPINPYAALAELYAEQEPKDPQRDRRERRSGR